MKIRKLRIRLSHAWFKVTFAIASLLLSFTAHAQEDKDSIKATFPLPVSRDSIKSDTIPLSDFEGLGISFPTIEYQMQAYGSAAILDIVYPPEPNTLVPKDIKPDTTTVDQSLE